MSDWFFCPECGANLGRGWMMERCPCCGETIFSGLYDECDCGEYDCDCDD